MAYVELDGLPRFQPRRCHKEGHGIQLNAYISSLEEAKAICERDLSGASEEIVHAHRSKVEQLLFHAATGEITANGEWGESRYRRELLETDPVRILREAYNPANKT